MKWKKTSKEIEERAALFQEFMIQRGDWRIDELWQLHENNKPYVSKEQINKEFNAYVDKNKQPRASPWRRW